MRGISAFQEVVIASGQTYSTPIDAAAYAICQVFMPAAITGSTFTFEARYREDPDSPTDPDLGWFTCTEEGTPISLAVGVDEAVRIPDQLFPAWEIRLKSSDSEAADRTIGIRLYA
jgi:hypothetical protein